MFTRLCDILVPVRDGELRVKRIDEFQVLSFTTDAKYPPWFSPIIKSGSKVFPKPGLSLQINEAALSIYSMYFSPIDQNESDPDMAKTLTSF